MKGMISFVCVFLVMGPGITAEESGPEMIPGMETAVEGETMHEGSRAPFWLTDGSFRYKIETIRGVSGAFWGTCIDEAACAGGDMRALFTLQGEFAISIFNMGRYDNHCGWISKGPLNLPPPLYMTWMNEFGTSSGGLTLVWDSADAWFHESVNDEQVQDWVAGPEWWIPYNWQPSFTYDMHGTGANAWNLTYYSANTYPGDGDMGFQYEVSLRKNSGGPTNTMGLYFNGDGTMNNGVVVGITSQGAYIVFEISGGTEYILSNWINDEAHLFQDDPGITSENVFNTIKVNVLNNGVFDIFFNQQYVTTIQAAFNMGGYVGIVVYDSISADHVSCDDMTVSTVPLLKENRTVRNVQRAVQAGGTNTRSSR